MSVLQIIKLNVRRIPCISFTTYSVFENIKSLERCFSKVKSSYTFKNSKHQALRNKNHSITSADLLSVASGTGTKRKSKTLTKPIHYKGEILYGIHPVYLALLKRKRHLFQLFTRIYNETCFSLEKTERINKIEKLARTLGIPVYNLNRQEMEYLVPGSVHQGVCLDVGPLPVLEWEDTKCTIKNQEDSNLPVWLVLDEILDPMNVGAVIRSAQYFGIDKLFVVKGSSCKLSPTVSKASCGALEVMDIYQIQKFESFLQMKKDQGWNIISTVAYCEDGSEASNQITDVTDFRISRPTILILGNEGKGVSPEIQKLCDTFVSIPPENNLQEGIDSLNVSVAAGIILYSLSTGRKKTGLNYD
ncbi:rRNA methyltransferase 1, mitochondrial-like [Argiope bruennichi]|uniref:rRNA methyltransferase 1, mitochondrial-like n=1 Tax=Argiope bruennichi TaxID=94029 RepID=UPI0024940158|nr:rRNA methyltransferase 1, mitochondrial-like [Argiope bruennichi]